MNLYRISQTDNLGYDTFSDAIVLAEHSDEAARTHPSGGYSWDDDREQWYVTRDDASRYYTDGDCGWAKATRVRAEFLGTADPRFVTMNIGQSRVVCASFHAG